MSSQPLNELRDSVDIPLKISNRTLAQFGFAGVDFYTLNFARIACVNYKPSTSGERIINHCLTNLPVYVAADDNLQFGWNEKYLYRNLDLHQFEYQHLLLISALSECLPEIYVAAVLNCLSDKYQDNDRIKPSLESWVRLVRSMNGILTTSEFALMVDERMRLDPYRDTSGASASCTNSLIPPAAFARTLQALGDLSLAGTGDLKLAGGNFVGWFAAFTEMFLCVNLRLTSRDGQELYATHAESKATLHLTFVDASDSDTHPDTLTDDLAGLSLKVMCTSEANTSKIPRMPFTGRVGWESLLPKVFESSFHRIVHQDSRCFVQSVGGVARIFAILGEDPSTPEELVSSDNRLNPASWGMGLIQTLCNWFPELRHLQGRLERLQKLDRTAAEEKCVEGAMSFAQICGCTICAKSSGNPGDYDSGRLPQSFCLLAIMETILNLGLAMSRITVVPSVFPSRAGILTIYKRQTQKLLTAKQSNNLEKFGRMKALFLNDWNANYSRRLQTAVAMFSGSWPEGDIPDNLCALKHEGICAYVMDVQYGDKSSKHRRDKDVIRVQAGHVAFRQKVFSRVTNGPPEGITSSDYTWEEETVQHMSKKLYFK